MIVWKKIRRSQAEAVLIENEQH